MTSSLASLASVFDGPAIVQYRGMTFFAKQAANFLPVVESTRILSDRFGALGARKGNVGLTYDLPLVGEYEALPVLLPYGSTTPGTMMGPTIVNVSSINTETHVLTTGTHGLTTGDVLWPGTWSDFPTSDPVLSNVTAVYARAASGTTLTLHESAADATNNTNPIEFSANVTQSGAASTYALRLLKENPLDVFALNTGQKLRLHNAGLVGMPDLTLGASETLLGTAKFEAFLRPGYLPADANSYYTVTEEAYSGTHFDPTAILTQPVSVALGASAPWSVLDVGAAVKIAWDLKQPTRVMADACGARGVKFADLGAKITLAPRGVNIVQALNKLALQGTAPGATRSAGVFNFSANGFYLRFYATNQTNAPHSFGGEADLHGDFEFEALRGITAGANDALFFAGTSSPD